MPTVPFRDTVAIEAAEVAAEQAHVDAVHAELAKAAQRADDVAADGLARGRTDRTGQARDEELTGLFERDALVHAAARRRAALDSEYEGLVFGRLDLGSGDAPAPMREIRYIGRLGVRDDDYEPLVIDWRAPAAAAFYRATPADPLGVIRRRVLRCKGTRVVGVEDDLMVPEAPEDLVVIGDGALIAALTRSRTRQMRDIVATIQRHQDEAIRAPARGVTQITGGPGTGKTVVALHRAAYLLYNERRRFETGGVLVVGPSAAYTAYIERVLPSLGEDSVHLRAVGDLVDGVTATVVDQPEVAQIKGGLRIRRLLARAAALTAPGAPTTLRTFIGGYAVRIDPGQLSAVRRQVLRSHQHNLAVGAARGALAELAWRAARGEDRADFVEAFEESRDVDEFMAHWWPQLDPREVLLRLTDTDEVVTLAKGILDHEEAAAFALSMVRATREGSWTVSDLALIDDLSARLGPVQQHQPEETGFYDIEAFEDLQSYGVRDVRAGRFRDVGRSNAGGIDGDLGAQWRPSDSAGVRIATDPLDSLLRGRIEPPRSYAHILVDEAQDLSPMQWRMVGRRGRHASWTIVGDEAQSSWLDRTEAAQASEAALAGQARQSFHMDTNYRNAREIFDYARDVVLPVVPDADIPTAVRETGVHPLELVVDSVVDGVGSAVDALLDEVEGSLAVIAPTRWLDRLAHLARTGEGRVQVLDPLSTKGLEWDATVVVDPDAIVDEAPGGIRLLYVVLTRAAHRMTLIRPA